jgi:hypothetical protein
VRGKVEKKLPIYLTPKQFRENIVNWSDDTLRNNIEQHGFPAIKTDSGRYLVPREDALLWFKRRTVKAG